MGKKMATEVGTCIKVGPHHDGMLGSPPSHNCYRKS